MSEIHKFLFEGAPVRGVLVRLTDAWTEILRRRAGRGEERAYPLPVRNLLGEMVAAATLMRSNIKFNGALVLQIFGDGPVKLAVAEIQSDLGVRATATINGEVAADARLSAMVNMNSRGTCAITLDPQTKFPGQQAYQGVVPLVTGERHDKLEKLSEVLEHYMLQSEQLDTTLVLAADDQVAAGLLIQRLPLSGARNLAGSVVHQITEDQMGMNEDYRRIALLASSLKREELLGLDVETILHRLFWQERVLRFTPVNGHGTPHFACTCSRERVGSMIRGLGEQEANSVIAEHGAIDVACEFCGQQYRFDSIDTAQIFRGAGNSSPASPTVQ